ncbi:hypothetical protein SAMN05518683_10360 [Salibacterium halotolerans]|uniref:Uncharacterized protein n=1 Tax=Salibacterium halotolerans TaxID=1884432 RepID=A0A1I5NBN9_9BACI|nr:hypothetical protein SAMN05518683_10360 [Salibacterium halotolerans]
MRVLDKKNLEEVADQVINVLADNDIKVSEADMITDIVEEKLRSQYVSRYFLGIPSRDKSA